LAELTEKIKAKGVEDLVLDPNGQGMSSSVSKNTQIRRLALKKNFKALGYPTISFPVDEASAAQAIAKYSGFVVLDHFAPELAYPLLVLRQNIYTDPQKPIQVQPGIYEINNPKPEDPLLVTTNFSITYFSVANEVEGSGLPAWLLVTDAEGMSVLTAWARVSLTPSGSPRLSRPSMFQIRSAASGLYCPDMWQCYRASWKASFQTGISVLDLVKLSTCQPS
jgi:acetyl-CoA decarbonylase/synthase, CODH/ACS complex subunit gamma